LRFPPDPEWHDRAVYGVGAAFQVGPGTAASILNLRVRGVPTIDLEAGNDILVFRRLDDLREERAMPLDRTERIRDPGDGREYLHVRYPPNGGFVPVGARLDSGAPHPAAGTGFGLAQTICFPCEGDHPQPAELTDIRRMFVVMQFAFDGTSFRVTSSRVVEGDALLPGWVVVNRPINMAVADGEDLLTGLVAGRPGEAHGSGLCRWRRGGQGWVPVSYTPVTPADCSFEPSLIRDTDGSLLFSARGWGVEGVQKALLAGLDQELKNCVRVWRSADGGVTWKQVLRVDRLRPWSPVVLSPTAEGIPYLCGNRLVPPRPNVIGRTTPDARMREILCMWPLSPARDSLLAEHVVLDAPHRFGPVPSGLTWCLDHPIGCVLDLADGRHSLLQFRCCDYAEVVSDSQPVPQTGCWIETVSAS